jgi:phage shock protein C
MNKRLFRSENERVLGGVCGGLGEYIGIDPVFVRIFFIIWMILGEAAVLVYFILWIVMPNESAAPDTDGISGEVIGARFRLMGQEVSEAARQPSPQLITYVGAGLIAWGAFQLLERIGLVWIPRQYTVYLWPAMLILAGGFVIYRAMTRK